MSDAQKQAIARDRLREQTSGPFAPRRTRLLLGYGYLAAVALACAAALSGTELLPALVQLLAVLVLVIASVLFVGGRAGISEPVATALAWAGFGAALGLPLVVTAVAFPEHRSDS